MTETAEVRGEQPLLVNLGCGPLGSVEIPGYFNSWRQLRVDVDPVVKPDIVADITDLSSIASGSVDAIWTAHCIEHLFAHQVPRALSEFQRILRDDGFACLIVPDLQTVANYVAADRTDQVLYEVPAGKITPHDVIFGFGVAIAAGRSSMAHRCGFTPNLLGRRLGEAGFAQIVLRRRAATLELAALARKTPWKDDVERSALLAALQL
jgi:predicted SAM-dependent methyltransferase